MKDSETDRLGHDPHVTQVKIETAVTTPSETATTSELPRNVRFPADTKDRIRRYSTLFALLVLVLIALILVNGFGASANLLGVGQQVAQIGIMAIGMTFVLINGEIDLSVGSIYGLAAVATGMLVAGGAAWPLAVLAGIAVGALCGLLNGVMTVGLHIPSFIVTLGTLSIFRGAALLLSDGTPISLPSNEGNVASFNMLGQGKVFGMIPMQLIVFLVLLILGYVLLSRSKLGYDTYAVGGSVNAARLSGINTGLVRIWSFVLSGACSGMAGILSVSFLSYVQGVTGQGMELTVISAVIIGGAALSGGTGTMWGTLIGVLFIGVLQNILNLQGISSFWQTVATGAVIIIAVAADTALSRSRK